MKKLKWGAFLLLGLLLVSLYYLWQQRQRQIHFLNPYPSLQQKADFLSRRLIGLKLDILGGPFFSWHSQVSFVLAGDMTVVFDLNKDIKSQLAVLQLILKKVTMENRRVRLIDLSLTNPHVVFKNN